jgi:hypothetical protein
MSRKSSQSNDVATPPPPCEGEEGRGDDGGAPHVVLHQLHPSRRLQTQPALLVEGGGGGGYGVEGHALADEDDWLRFASPNARDEKAREARAALRNGCGSGGL